MNRKWQDILTYIGVAILIGFTVIVLIGMLHYAFTGEPNWACRFAGTCPVIKVNQP